MRWPFNPFKTDQDFANQSWYGPHEGLDINGLGGGNTDCGFDLFPIYEGEIVHTSESTKDYGNLIVYRIEGPWGTRWVRYAHCQEFIRKSGKIVENEPIAKMGSTGNSTACHLHFDILRKKPTRWRFYTKDQEKFGEYFEDPQTFIESWKDYLPPTPAPTYAWLENLATENGISKPKIEGWIREALDNAKRFKAYSKLLIECEVSKNNLEIELKELKKPIPVHEKADDTPTTEVTEDLGEGGDGMDQAQISQKRELIEQDWQKWGKNTLIFAAPVILALMGQVGEVIPAEAAWGAVTLYLVNIFIDLFKKWVQENKYGS